MDDIRFRSRLPGCFAAGLLIIATSLWTLWGFGEMYYEGWWGAWYNRMPYLVPAAVCLILTLLVLTWPKIGGWLAIVIGVGFTARWFWRTAAATGMTFGKIAGMFPVSAVLVIIGVLFIIEGRYRDRLRSTGWQPPVK